MGKRLESLIKERGISKAEFARLMGIKPQNVNLYLEGRLDTTNLYFALSQNDFDIDFIESGESSKNKLQKPKKSIALLTARIKDLEEENEILRKALSPETVRLLLSSKKK